MARYFPTNAIHLFNAANGSIGAAQIHVRLLWMEGYGQHTASCSRKRLAVF